jgi:hypothetical protein
VSYDALAMDRLHVKFDAIIVIDDQLLIRRLFLERRMGGGMPGMGGGMGGMPGMGGMGGMPGMGGMGGMPGMGGMGGMPGMEGMDGQMDMAKLVRTFDRLSIPWGPCFVASCHLTNLILLVYIDGANGWYGWYAGNGRYDGRHAWYGWHGW